MRTLPSGQSNILDSGSYQVKLRVQVKDSGGTFRDLTTYSGWNLVDGASWGETLDDPCCSADITLKREAEKFSLAVLMEGSPLNKGMSPSGSYSPLLWLWREVKIETAIFPFGDSSAAVDGDYTLQFHGYIDSVNHEGENIVLSCRDLGAKLVDVFIENELVYGYQTGAGTSIEGLRVFQENFPYTTDMFVVPSNGKLTGYYYQCTTAGSSGTEPTSWPVSVGGTVTTGTATFTRYNTTTASGEAVEDVMQRIINDNWPSGTAPTLYVPTSPSWNIKSFIQERESIMDAVRDLANQIGWDIRYKWRSGTSQFELTLFEPQRSKTTPDRTLSGSSYLTIDAVRIDISMIRNVVRVWYDDSADLDMSGNALRKSVSVSSSASITDYGRRFMEVSEDATKGIDTSTEATRLANGILSDLATPEAEVAINDLYLPIVELGDLYRFSSNGRTWDADLDVAVVGYQHTIQNGEARTSITCRGKPAGLGKKWFQIQGWGKYGPPIHKTVNFGTNTQTASNALTVTSTVAGAQLLWNQSPIRNTTFEGYEVHLSTSSGFTPSSSTFKGFSSGTRYEITGLLPGTTYYLKYTAVGRNAGKRIVSLPSAEFSFTPSYAEAKHISPSMGLELPLNGNFATTNTPSGGSIRPDHWTNSSGTWGTHLLLQSGAEGFNGTKWVEFPASAGNAQAIESSSFPVSKSGRYMVRVQGYNVSGTGNWVIMMRLFDSAGTLISEETQAVDVTTSVSSWVMRTAVFDVTSTTCTATIRITKETTANATRWLVGSVEVVPVKAQEPWVTASLENSWVSFDGSSTPAYFMDDRGIVYLKGLVKNGTTTDGLAIFTLPEGYRPVQRLYFAVTSYNGTTNVHGRVDVYTDGKVAYAIGSNNYLGLDNIRFPAF